MSYHEAYWVAIAAAAPVIALANTVAITDAVSTWLDTRREDHILLLRVTFFYIIFISAGNFFGQTLALTEALASLRQERDIRTPLFAEDAVYFGLVFVLLIVIASAAMKYRFAGSKREEPNQTGEKQDLQENDSKGESQGSLETPRQESSRTEKHAFNLTFGRLAWAAFTATVKAEA